MAQASKKFKQFNVGQSVYVRFFGDQRLTIESIAKVGSPFPHYVCSLNGCNYLISRLYISLKRLSPETKDSNRLQLSLPLTEPGRIERLDSWPVAL